MEILSRKLVRVSMVTVFLGKLFQFRRDRAGF